MIYYIAHWDWILKNSRAEIAKKVDFDIAGISPIIDYKDELEDAFSRNINWKYKRQKLIHLMGIFRLRRLIKNFKEKDILHIFTLKSLIIYLISSIFTNKKYTVIASVTGLGYLFANTKFANFLKLVLRYFISSRINSLVDVIIFQNRDNQTKFVEYTKFKNRVEIIEGSGLQTKLITKKESFNKKLKIIFVGRLLKEKGIFEYIDIINHLSNHEDLEFYIAGSRDPGNRSSLTEKDFKNIQDIPDLQYLGEIDINSELYKYDILVLPSYHEGFSRILLEAAYTGLYCIVNDIPGTRNIISATNCGKLIKENNIEQYVNELTNICKKLPELNHSSIRETITENYSVEAIAMRMTNLYKEYV